MALTDASSEKRKGIEDVESILISDIARRAITSRDEVVGLLKWLKAIAESSGVEFRPGLNQQTDRLLEIVEGK